MEMPKEMTLSNYAKGAKPTAPPVHNESTTTVLLEGEQTNAEKAKSAPPAQTATTETELQEATHPGKPVEVHAGKNVITPTSKKGKEKGPHTYRPKEDPRQGAIRMSPAQIQAARVKSGAIEAPQEEKLEDPPVIANAFKALNDRIERSKKEIDEIMMPIVMQNAQEIALENQKQMEQEVARQSSEMDELEIENSGIHRVSPIGDLDDDDFSELNEDNLLEDMNPENHPAIRSLPKIDPSKREYNFETNNHGDDEDMDKEKTDINPTEETIQPLVNSPSPLEPPTMKPEELPPEPAPEGLIHPIEDKQPMPMMGSEPPEVDVLASDRFKIATEDTQEVDDTKEPELEDDIIIDTAGNKVSFSQAMADLDKDENASDDEAVTESPEEQDKRIRKQFEGTKIIQAPQDLSKFQIRSRPVGSAYILNAVQNNLAVKKADWVLFHTGRAMRFTECIGPELDNLRKSMNAANRINRVRLSMQFIYDHVEDANKPPFEEWCKLYRTEDINSGYFGIYRANYSDTNLLPRTCPSCKKTSLVDTNIDDMVVYGLENDDHEKVKKKFMDILNGDTTTAVDSFKATLMQISDDFAVAYTPASIYSTFIQYSTLKDNFMQKYADLLDMLAHIDTFFYIDKTTNELVPIAIKEYPGKLDKTIMSRIQAFHGVLKTLTLDQYDMFNDKMDNVIKPSKISYKFPKAVCPICGKEIAEEPIDSILQLLFTRAQLARIKNL